MIAERKKVLIVEDEFVLYDELYEFFEKEGFSVIGHPDKRAVDNYDDAVKLMESEEPDIAILDIKIDGMKDGLDLAAYIRSRFQTLILIMSVSDANQNIDRAVAVDSENYILKVGKPVDKRYLHAAINFALKKNTTRQPRNNFGDFFKAREVDKSVFEAKHKKSNQSPADPIETETFIKWEDIAYIESFNKPGFPGFSNNTILIYTFEGKAFLSHGSLDTLYPKLPETFMRPNRSSIVNIPRITAKTRDQSVKVGEKKFLISDVYAKEALARLRRVLGYKLG